MSDIITTVKVVGLIPDIDQLSGKEYTQINFGIETSVPSLHEQQRVKGWKYMLNIFIPKEEWNNQYNMWQKFDLTIKDSGEIFLKPKENDT
jgi:hypothetical protein